MATAEQRVIVPGLVSVITASYNMGRYIPETIDAILGQDYPQVESIIVDDGSTDDTAAVLGRYAADSRVTVVRQANAGQTVAKNRGIAEARGEFIAFCDADDVWEPAKLARQLPLFADARVGVVFSEISYIDEHGKAFKAPLMKRFEGRVTAELLLDNFVPFPTAVVRASVLRELGGFDESLAMSIDYDLWLRISARYDFACVREPLARYRIWSGQMSHRTGQRLDDYFKLLGRFLAANPDAVSRRDVARAYAHVHATRGYWHAHEGRRDEAWRDYREALRHRPVDLRTWRRIGSLVLRRGGRMVPGDGTV